LKLIILILILLILTYITGSQITVLKNQGGFKKAIFWLIMVSISITFNYLIFLPVVCMIKTKLLLKYGPFNPRKFSFDIRNLLFQFFITETDRAIYKELKEFIKNKNSEDDKVMTSIFELENDLGFMKKINRENNNNYNYKNNYNNKIENKFNNFNDEEEDLLDKNKTQKIQDNKFNENININLNQNNNEFKKRDSKNKIPYNKISPFNENNINDDNDFNNKNNLNNINININKLNIEEIQTKLKNPIQQDEFEKKEFFEKNNIANNHNYIISEPRISSENHNDINNSDNIFEEESPVKLENYSKKNSRINDSNINNPNDDYSPVYSRIISNNIRDSNNMNNNNSNTQKENNNDNNRNDDIKEERKVNDINFTD
jgi:hypothetical protein